MTNKFFIITLFICTTIGMHGVEYHVSMKGSDQDKGTSDTPFRTINKAARTAVAGDIITVHEGIYREWVNPLNGGTSLYCRIVYRAAEGEKVEIKGSERIVNWTKEKSGVWKAVIPNTLFGNYNPFDDLIHGDWFDNYKRDHHTADVFLNEVSLYEVTSLAEVLNPTPIISPRDPQGSTTVWWASVSDHTTTIWANFGQANPNKELTEITVRPTCIYPTKQGVNFITIKGFHISQAATQWAAPTAEQVGMVATHWNKGWIIEHNVLKNSRCSGITLGKEHSTGHNVWLNNTSKDGSLHYIEVTFNALRHGWSKDKIGGHIVRYNTISDCEQTGMCGSMGCAFSEVYGNHIYNIWVKRQFNGAEIAGIKFHAAIDTYLHNNRIHNVGRGVWFDWMTQGTRFSSNLLYNNDLEDIFLEVDHGPYMIDNNILLSPRAILEQTEGGAFVHNIIGGSIYNYSEFGRYTPYHLNHSTQVMGLAVIANGDHRYYNNVFLPNSKKKGNDAIGTIAYDNAKQAKQPILAEGNLFLGEAKPQEGKNQGMVFSEYTYTPLVEEVGEEVYLTVMCDEEALKRVETKRIESKMLGLPLMTLLPYENADGTPISIDRDYFGKPRDSKSPTAGPFEQVGEGRWRVKVW